MILGFIIESVTAMPLDRYVETTIYKPLGLKHTVFNPLMKGFTPPQIAATELHGNTRDGVIHFLIFAPVHYGARCMTKSLVLNGWRFRTRRTLF